jgi:DNA repair exonuclease SbcCD ATPase subunit
VDGTGESQTEFQREKANKTTVIASFAAKEMNTALFEELRQKAAQLQGQRDALTSQVERLRSSIQAIQEEGEVLEAARVLIDKAATKSREDVANRIERMVSYALRDILQREDYRFELAFEHKRGRIEASPVLHTATSSGNPLDNNGGGVVDIIATTLRLIVKLSLNVPGPIIVDEPAKWIAEAHRPRFMAMLKDFSMKTGTQIIVCTHIAEYVSSADKIFEVRLAGGESKVHVKA